MRKGNLEKIKNRSNSSSELTAPIAADYVKNASTDIIRTNEAKSQEKLSDRDYIVNYRAASLTDDRIKQLIVINSQSNDLSVFVKIVFLCQTELGFIPALFFYFHHLSEYIKQQFIADYRHLVVKTEYSDLKMLK